MFIVGNPFAELKVLTVERDAALAGQQVGRSCCKQQSHFVLLIKRTELTR
jgi:hypothetical protein